MKKLLLLHGALGSKDQFNGLTKKLSGRFEVHSFNFRGHGGRDIPDEPFSIVMFADDAINYINKNHIDSCNIFGYSMGGYAALYAALKKPGLIEKIFTLGTKFNWTPETAVQEVKMIDAKKIKQKVPKFAEELIIRHGAGKWERVLEKTAEMMINLGNDNTLKHNDLGKITNKVLVGSGDRDKMVTLEETMDAYRNLPNAELTVLPGTHHPIEMVDTLRLSDEIIRFFD